MAAQASRARRLAAADDVIDNSGSFAQLREQVDALHSRYAELASQRA
jgi:dephospho-CoA kinase